MCHGYFIYALFVYYVLLNINIMMIIYNHIIIMIIQGGPGNTTHPYLLKLLQVAEILLIILFQNGKAP